MKISLPAMMLTIKLALKSVLLHKLRSALTILGILIGVTAVVWLVAMGEGVSYQAQQQIKNLGATSIIVRSVKPPDQSMAAGGRMGSLPKYGITRDDFERVRSTVPGVVQAVPVREVTRGSKFKNRSLDCRVVGCTADYLDLNHLKIGRGRFLSDHDNSTTDNICVIADNVAERLFPYEDPVGKTVQIDLDFYVIVGQTENRTPSAGIGGSMAAQDFNLDIYIPINTMRVRFGDTNIVDRAGSFTGEILQLSQITLRVADMDRVDAVAGMIEELIKRYHPMKDYAIVVPKELLRQAETLQMLFTVLLILISGISLVVGGIGIMNIMLATVTERTREIGIRRALGAKQAHIMWQFLSETLVLTSLGGLTGVLLGVLCKPVVRLSQKLLAWFAPQLYSQIPDSIRNLEPRVALWSIIVSLAIALLVGVFFGLYPARRAAMMDPIEALRHE